MKRVDGMITDNRKRLLHKLHIGQVLKVSVSLKLHLVVFLEDIFKTMTAMYETSAAFCCKLVFTSRWLQPPIYLPVNLLK